MTTQELIAAMHNEAQQHQEVARSLTLAATALRAVQPQPTLAGAQQAGGLFQQEVNPE